MDSHSFFQKLFNNTQYFRIMKNFLQKYFGYFGLVIYVVVAVILRIPAFVILALFLIFGVLLWQPITGNDDCPKWLTNLYDWYCGK